MPADRKTEGAVVVCGTAPFRLLLSVVAHVFAEGVMRRSRMLLSGCGLSACLSPAVAPHCRGKAHRFTACSERRSGNRRIFCAQERPGLCARKRAALRKTFISHAQGVYFSCSKLPFLVHRTCPRRAAGRDEAPGTGCGRCLS